MVWDEDVIKWCFEHGAQVSDGAEDKGPYNHPPLTENFARLCTVPKFKLIRAKGVTISRRTLHQAVNSAASCLPANKAERMAMVKYLVEEERLDVNQMDTAVQFLNHYGTPICMR